MKIFGYALLAAATLFTACSTPTPQESVTTQPGKTITFPEKLAGATIYEVNIRQHTAEGTIKAFVNDLPRLKELGVKMLWIMPVQPIGVKNRKEPLGSYYSIRNYTEVNPEFGTKDDFKKLVDEAHKLGLYVILDWVPNHTAWDHPWITAHPEYYAHKADGEIAHEADWTDIALLDHTNPDTRAAMIKEMKYWVSDFDIDGFRCDHAGHEIPMYFWEEATAEINLLKDLFWLAEWDGARMHLAFDGTYAWELLHLSNAVAKGKAHASDMATWINNDLKEYGRKPLRMTMITNHDENSWNGTVFERYGDGTKTFAAFIFSAYGIPMLYSGQEVGLNKRLKFFEKDTIDWSDPMKFQPFYEKLIALKADNPAIWCGEFGAMPVYINSDKDVLAFRRAKGNNTVIGIMNFTDKPQEMHLTDAASAGTYTDYFTGESVELSVDKPLSLKPWQYLIFANNR